jgi:hypothetical protein
MAFTLFTLLNELFLLCVFYVLILLSYIDKFNFLFIYKIDCTISVYFPVKNI